MQQTVAGSSRGPCLLFFASAMRNASAVPITKRTLSMSMCVKNELDTDGRGGCGLALLISVTGLPARVQRLALR